MLLVTGQGCHLSFEVHASGTAMVRGNPLGTTVPVDLGPLAGFGAFDITQTQDFKNHNIDKSAVESVKLSQLKLTITQPSNETFDFLNSIQFEVGADGQPTQPCAQKNPVPKGVSMFTTDLDDLELLPYVAAPTMSLTANAAGQPPAQDTTIQIDAVFIVTTKI